VRTKNRRATVAAWLAAAAVIALSLHPLCELQFACGCEPVWSGGAEHCNVQQPGPPDCPWCTGGVPRLLWVGAIVLGSTALATHQAGRRWQSWRAHGLAALAGYLLGALAAGLAAALASGYPHWLGRQL
jgi:hypothetical protein